MPGIGDVLGRIGGFVRKNPLPLAVAGAGIAGAIGGTRANRTGTTLPTAAPGYATLGDMLRQRAEDRLRSQFDLGGYAAHGIENINSAFNPVAESIGNSLTARGLGGSPIAGNADVQLQLARGSNIAQFLNTLPQLKRQFQLEDLGAAQSVYQQGLGATTVQPGSPFSSGLGSAAELLAYLHGQEIFKKKGP